MHSTRNRSFQKRVFSRTISRHPEVSHPCLYILGFSPYLWNRLLSSLAYTDCSPTDDKVLVMHRRAVPRRQLSLDR